MEKCSNLQKVLKLVSLRIWTQGIFNLKDYAFFPTVDSRYQGENTEMFSLFFLKHWKLLWWVSQLEYHCYLSMFVGLVNNLFRLYRRVEFVLNYILFSSWLNWVCRISIPEAISYSSVFTTSVIQVQMSTLFFISIYHLTVIYLVFV